MSHGFEDSSYLTLPEATGAREKQRRRTKLLARRVLASLPFCVLLFLATVVTTLIVGAHLAANYAAARPLFDLDVSWAFFAGLFDHPSRLWAGAPYAFSAIAILLAHEMGHYLTCRRYHIQATYPYFLPAPTVVGTWGAFIQIKSSLATRQELFDIGISGPIAGFLVAVPMLIVAAADAGRRTAALPREALVIGHPLAITLLARLFHPTIASAHLALTPLGGGVWVGLFVTALNLIPIGQLDGGHIFYAAFGRAHRYVSIAFFVALIPMGYFYWPGWWLWAVLMIVIGLRHPPPLIDSEPLDRWRKLLVLAALAMLVLCFMPSPLSVT
ncbi:MAG: site-2 protease family protein [Terriglobia bacterium]